MQQKVRTHTSQYHIVIVIDVIKNYTIMKTKKKSIVYPLTVRKKLENCARLNIPLCVTVPPVRDHVPLLPVTA